MTDDEVVLYLDTETFSERPLSGGNSVGTYAYAEVVEILMLQWALDGPWGEGEIVVEDLTNDEGEGVLPCSDGFLAALTQADRIVIHNSGFDLTVVRASDQIPDLPLHRVEDTMIRAMEHGLPGGLDKLSTIFKLGDDAKHGGGKDLINLFCKLQPKGRAVRRHTKNTKPDEWQRFLSYGGGDIQAMRALRKKLPSWNYPGKPEGNQQSAEMRLFQLDRTINDRGFKVDIELADAALEMIARVKVDHDDYFNDTTDGDVQSAGQRDKLLKHLLEQYGVTLPDMTKGTIERRLADPDLPDIVKELLATRLDAAMASTSKYKALKRAVSHDGRLRGTLQFCGAVRTSRWCLAEGSRVLVCTFEGRIEEKPIEQVRSDDRVFDGEDWVSHEGVVFSGDKDVIEHDGVVATARHLVYVSASESLPLGEAKAKDAKLWRGKDTPSID